MFKLLKWTAIIFVIAVVLYGVNFYLSLNEQERNDASHQAKVAFDETVIKHPLAERVRADLYDKKEAFMDFVKGVLHR